MVCLYPLPHRSRHDREWLICWFLRHMCQPLVRREAVVDLAKYFWIAANVQAILFCNSCCQVKGCADVIDGNIWLCSSIFRRISGKDFIRPVRSTTSGHDKCPDLPCRCIFPGPEEETENACGFCNASQAMTPAIAILLTFQFASALAISSLWRLSQNAAFSLAVLASFGGSGPLNSNDGYRSVL